MFYKSPLNYIGGKWKLLPQILPLFPSDINVFVDLFVGGGNVAVNAEAKRYVWNDRINYLIDLYRMFQSLTVQETLSYIEEQIDEYQLTYVNEEGYTLFRQKYNLERNPLDLFILTAFSFNHQIRFNSKFEFNNPFGRNRSRFNDQMRSNLIDFIEIIRHKHITFSSLDFREFDYPRLTSKDFVYCDPPYLITTGSYNDGARGFGGWTSQDEQDLLDVLSDLDYHGVRFALSNVLRHKGKENTQLVDWLKQGEFVVHPIRANYQNSNYQSKDNQETQEVLIVNYQSIQRQKTLF